MGAQESRASYPLSVRLSCSTSCSMAAVKKAAMKKGGAMKKAAMKGAAMKAAMKKAKKASSVMKAAMKGRAMRAKQWGGFDFSALTSWPAVVDTFRRAWTGF